MVAPAHVPFSLPVAESNASLPPTAGDPRNLAARGAFLQPGAHRVYLVYLVCLPPPRLPDPHRSAYRV